MLGPTTEVWCDFSDGSVLDGSWDTATTMVCAMEAESLNTNKTQL